jgi:Asp/Glu/hydantoin racemase
MSSKPHSNPGVCRRHSAYGVTLASARTAFSGNTNVGMAEAAMLTACMTGRRFGLVTFARALGPWYEECVRAHGLWERCAGIRMLDGPFREIAEVGAEKEDLLVELAKRAVEEDEPTC